MTNAEKFRNMSDDELANYFTRVFSCVNCPIYKECKQSAFGCYYKLFKWLKTEADNAG